MRFPSGFVRKTDPKYASGYQTGYSDGFPFLVLSEESLADLNARIAHKNRDQPNPPEPLKMERFRPNIVIRGGNPFGEDTWQDIRIGSVKLKIVKPCSRCKMPTVDQATAEMGMEPTHTLKTYRTGSILKLQKPSWNDEVFFGQNAVATTSRGSISVGDRVEVLRKQAWAMAIGI